MRHAQAAILFVALAMSGAVALAMSGAQAGPIETSELPPPEAATPDSAALKTLIEQQLAPGEIQRHDPEATPNWQLFSAESWLDGVPAAFATYAPPLPVVNTLRYPGALEVKAPDRKLPTKYNFHSGDFSADFTTNVSTASASPSVIPTTAYAGAVPNSGGSGEFKSRLEYDADAWQFYGGTSRSLIANADGTIGFGNTIAAGTYYSLPELLGGKIGTGLEFSPAGSATTRLEYRRKFGTTEGFLAAERAVPFDQFLQSPADPVSVLKAGVNRKF